MNNIFLEGPIQTGKSTYLRKVLRDRFGPDLAGVAGFTSQRITDPDGTLLGFRLAPADAPLSVAVDPAALADAMSLSGLTTSGNSPSGPDNIFKWFTPDGARVDMSVFETAGIQYMDDALSYAKAGQAQIILLDEIGGHELKSDLFRSKLYELLDSEFPCVGVIKSPDNTRRMDPELLDLNAELHKHLSVTTVFDDFVLPEV